MSILPGRCFLFAVFGGAGASFSASFEETGAASVFGTNSLEMSASAPRPVAGESDVVDGCSLRLVCSSGCLSFGIAVGRADGVGRTGMTGLIVAPLVTFRWRRGAEAGGAVGATSGGKS